MGYSNDHLEQVRSFILKNGFQEPIIIISCDLESGNAYITEGSHCLCVDHKEGIPSLPCCVIPHWLSLNGSYTKLYIDLFILRPMETILRENIALIF